MLHCADDYLQVLFLLCCYGISYNEFINLLYKAEKLSVRTFLAVSFSAVAAWIDVRLARCDSYVFWHDEVYF